MEYRQIRVRKNQHEALVEIAEKNALKNTEVLDILIEAYKNSEKEPEETRLEKQMKRIERLLLVYNASITEVMMRNNINLMEQNDEEGDS